MVDIINDSKIYFLYIFVLILIYLTVKPLNFLYNYKIINSFIIIIIVIYLVLFKINVAKSLQYIGTIKIVIIFFILLMVFLYFTEINVKLIKNQLSILTLYNLLLILIIVGLYVQTTKVGNMYHISNILYYILLYIPCLIYDTIMYIIDDYNKTTSKPVIFIIIIFCIMIFIHFYYYLIDKYYNGILLIDEKTLLNKEIINISLNELNHEIIKENFIDIEETERTKYLDLLDYNIDKIDKYNIYTYDEEVEYKRKNNINPKYKDLIIKKKNVYEYGVSFWLYLNSDVLDNIKQEEIFIVSFSNNPKVYYDFSKKLLIIDYIHDNTNKKILYVADKILLQKWNHIVLNYVNGIFDIFIDKKLVSSNKNVSPYIDDNSSLIIGSPTNNKLSSIYQFRYFKYYLDNNKIEQLYNFNKLFK